MPFGLPCHVVPKSGCKTSFGYMLLIRFAEFGLTGRFEMSWFHGLSGGKSCLPWRLAPGPRSGTWPELVVTVRGRVGACTDACDAPPLLLPVAIRAVRQKNVVSPKMTPRH